MAIMELSEVRDAQEKEASAKFEADARIVFMEPAECFIAQTPFG
jgi:hypothetical protein